MKNYNSYIFSRCMLEPSVKQSQGLGIALYKNLPFSLDMCRDLYLSRRCLYSDVCASDSLFMFRYLFLIL